MKSMILRIFQFHSPSLSHLKIKFALADSSSLEHHGSMQLSRPQHQLDCGDAAHWRTIPSDDRISLDLAPGGEYSTDSADVGTHRLCPTHQSAQVQCSLRHHLSLFFSQALEICIDLTLPLLNLCTNLHFPLHFDNFDFIVFGGN